ncbi:MAG: sensor histidine kinase [Lachnospiraceae bacterium]
MRRLKKPTSIVNYISNCFTLFFIIVLLIMWGVIWSLSNTAIRSDIHRELRLNLKHGRHRMVETADGWKPADSFVFYDKNDHLNYVVLDRNGKLLFGSYPKGFSATCPVGNQTMQVVKSSANHQTYYIMDIRKRRADLYIRCILAKKDMNSKYQFIQKATFIFFPAVILLLFVMRHALERQINRRVEKICQKVAAIGKGDNLSERINYSGDFEELRVFSDASDAMLDRVEQMLESQKQFTDNVAHELRTPLAVIMAQCDHLNGRRISDAEQAEGLDVLLRQSKKMNDIVNQMLKLSRLEMNRTTLYFEEVEISEIIYSVCDEITYKSKKEIDFKLDVHQEKAEIDIGLATVLFQNLIENAVKYGGDPALVHISASETADTIHVSITDNGCGIAKEKQNSVMQRFYRGGGSDDMGSKEVEGFGLGLPLAHTIALKHGGDITVYSEVNVGSTFTVILPKKQKMTNS